MSMPFEQIKNSALSLDLASRADLARILLESLDEPSDAETDALWLEEAERRRQEVSAGAARLRDGDEVFRRIAAMLE